MKRIEQRGISQSNVEDVLKTGEIIEDYPNDYPFPSCLMLGRGNKTLHVVCGVGKDRLWIVTAYYPNPEKWQDDYKTRKETL